MRTRRIVFWLHLTAGAAAGVVVLIMAASGVLLAAQKPVLAFAERGLRVAPPSTGIPRLDLDALIERARAASPDAKPDGAILRSDPGAPVAVGFGRERTVFLNPYDGSVLVDGAASLRRFFQGAEEWHRWLAAPGKHRPLGRTITGACNAAFLFLALSGPFLWWPRRRTRTTLRASLLPSLKGHGKARDWNWHNAFGIWSAPFLLLITSTGVVMSYPWANDLLYKAAGDTPPPRARPQDATTRGVSHPVISFEALAAAARSQAPDWRVMTVRLPQRGSDEATVLIEEAGSPAYLRSTLTLDAATAKVVRWEPPTAWSRGRRLRLFARFSHTGETGGPLGQVIAGLASLCGVILVWTGLSLALHRLRGALSILLLASLSLVVPARAATIDKSGKTAVAPMPAITPLVPAPAFPVLPAATASAPLSRDVARDAISSKLSEAGFAEELRGHGLVLWHILSVRTRSGDRAFLTVSLPSDGRPYEHGENDMKRREELERRVAAAQKRITSEAARILGMPEDMVAVNDRLIESCCGAGCQSCLLTQRDHSEKWTGLPTRPRRDAR